jgi:hypothetical protein
MKSLKPILYLTLMLSIILSSCENDDDEPPQLPEDNKVELTIKFDAYFDAMPLEFGKQYITSSNDSIQFDKLKYIISNFTLIDQNNVETKLSDQYAYLSIAEDRNSVVLKNVPKGQYKAIRFFVGLDSAVNYGNPSQWPLDHPLSPSLTEMHWGWAGGYIFNIVEGYFLNNGKTGGFSFHIATPKYARTHAFVTDYSITNNSIMKFKIQANKYFDNQIKYSLKTDGKMSHSGNNDPIMDLFIQNNSGIFEFNTFE